MFQVEWGLLLTKPASSQQSEGLPRLPWLLTTMPTVAATCEVLTLCQAISYHQLPFFFAALYYRHYHLYFTEGKRGSLMLSNFAQIHTSGKKQNQTWTHHTKDCAQCAFQVGRGPSSQKRSDDHIHEIREGLMLQIPETKIQGINYLQGSFLRKSKGQTSIDYGYYNLLQDEVSSFPFW